MYDGELLPTWRYGADELCRRLVCCVQQQQTMHTLRRRMVSAARGGFCVRALQTRQFLSTGLEP